MEAKVHIARVVSEIEVDMPAAWDIEKCWAEALKLAAQHQLPIKFSKDGNTCTAKPTDQSNLPIGEPMVQTSFLGAIRV
jgi:hypothetical protein